MVVFFRDPRDSLQFKVGECSKVTKYQHNKILNQLTKFQKCNVMEYNTKKYKTFEDVTRI